MAGRHDHLAWSDDPPFVLDGLKPCSSQGLQRLPSLLLHILLALPKYCKIVISFMLSQIAIYNIVSIFFLLISRVQVSRILLALLERPPEDIKSTSLKQLFVDIMNDNESDGKLTVLVVNPVQLFLINNPIYGISFFTWNSSSCWPRSDPILSLHPPKNR